MLNTRHNWTTNEIYIITNNWHNTTKDQIQKLLPNISYNSIRNKAKYLKLKKVKKYFPNLELLLSDSLVAFYWVGFILADGSINDTRIKIELSDKDRDHLALLCKFCNTHIKRSSVKYKDYAYCAFSVGDKLGILNLRKKFDIKDNKTYNPPNIIHYKKFTNEQLLSLIIGFLDGDGHIRKQSKCNSMSIKLENHISWKLWHEFITNVILDIIKCKNLPKQRYPSGRNTVETNLNGIDIYIYLKQFIVTHDIPAMTRKWKY